MAEEKKDNKEEVKEEEAPKEEPVKEEAPKEEPVKEEAPKEEPVKEEAKKEEVPAKKEAPKEEKEVPEKFKKLVKSIEDLSVLELSELVKVLEEKFGVSASAPVAAAAPAAAPSGEGEDSGEKSEYTVELKDAGDKKIETIKAVRTITGKGLKEAKDLVDAVSDGPQVVKEGVPTEEAKEAEKTLKEAGAVVELK